MKIQYVSDLHLEFPENRVYLQENPLETAGVILIIAGDTVTDRQKKKVRSFYEQLRKEYRLIISCFGNHDFYRGTIDYALPVYHKEAAPNHFLLNNSSLEFEGIRFLVTTLWSHIPVEFQESVETKMNDYRLISRRFACEEVPITAADTNRYHDLSLQFLNRELGKPYGGKTVVISHHLPSYKLLHGDISLTDLRFGYASDLDSLIGSSKIDFWIFGHQHHSVNVEMGDTRLLSNPLGYPDERCQKSFSRDMFFEV